jgi:beta-lactamase class D
MPKAAPGRVLAALIIPLALGACTPPARDQVDKDKLNADIDSAIGGLGTCVIVQDTQTGRKVYQYGHYDICSRPLPPCETFEAPAALIGLDAGLVTPQTVFKWDGTPQPTKLWQTDANLSQAFQNSNGWWFARLSQQIGHDRYASALRSFDYGSKDPAGPITSFWRGPAQGGSLGISPGGQADFMRRLYTGKLAVKPASLQAVQALLQDETRGTATMSGLAASCPDQADRARGVGWWVGRLKSPQRDLVFAAVVEAAEPPPGSDVGASLKEAFADAGLWPSN